MSTLLDTDINTLETTEVLSCRELWMSVIDQALVDALNNSRRPQNIKDRIQALKWLFIDEVNFEEVCQLAGLDHAITKQKIYVIIASYSDSKSIIGAINKMKIDEYRKFIIIKSINEAKNVNKFSSINKSFFRSSIKDCRLRHNYSVLKRLQLCPSI